MYTILNSPVESSQSLSNNQEKLKTPGAHLRCGWLAGHIHPRGPGSGGTHRPGLSGARTFFKQERIAVAGHPLGDDTGPIESCAH